ncbi:tetratricopeptide repeat protein [Streptomyces antimycoticus]
MFGEAAALIDLGSVCNKLGRYAEAADHSRQALSICRVMGHQRNEGLSLRQLGSALLGMGELDKAMIHLHQSLDISHKLGSPGLQAFALQSMAGVCRERGQNADAVDHLKKAAALYRAQRSDHDYAEILIDLGTVLSGMDRLCEARESWEEAHAILTELDFQQAALVSKLLEHAGHPRTSGTSDAAKDQP